MWEDKKQTRCMLEVGNKQDTEFWLEEGICEGILETR